MRELEDRTAIHNAFSIAERARRETLNNVRHRKSIVKKQALQNLFKETTPVRPADAR